MFDDFPIQYIDPVYRPPSEARSLILPVTNGCSWNQCTFCEMYTDDQKKFYARKEEEVLRDIERAGQQLMGVHKVFLADGDAMVLSTRRLSVILDALNKAFPELTRVGAYCLPRNIAKKTVDELITLRNKGLGILYIGIESGDDEILQRIQKGETAESTYLAAIKAQQAGIKTSVMVLNGLGGRKLSEQHAINSAKLINRIQPDYLSTLVLTFHKGDQKYKQAFGDEFEAIDTDSLLNETFQFINALELKSTIYRSDHVSNRLVLKGVLGKDKPLFLSQILEAKQHNLCRNITLNQI